MKKALIIIAAVLLVLVIAAAAAWFYLPSLAFRMAGQALGGSIEASKSDVSYRNGLIVLSFEGIRLKGSAEGRIGRCEIEVLPSKGIYIKRLSASDFDIRVPKAKGHLAFYPVPVELAEIGKGFFEYGGRKYTVRELHVTDFNTGKTMRFSIDAGIEGIGDVKTHGEGIFGKTDSDVKGDYTLSKVNLSFLKDYEGLVDVNGRFSYRGGKLVMDGEARSVHLSIWEKFFVRRLSAENTRCDIRVTWSGDMVEVSLGGLSFDGAPLSLDIKTMKKKLSYFALTMGYVRIPVLFSYLDLRAFSDKDWGPFSYVKDGQVQTESFVFAKGEPFRAKVHLRNASGGDGTIFVREAQGTLQVDGQALLLSNLSARFGDGFVRDVSGVVPLKAGRDINIKGTYVLALKDLNRFNDKMKVEATGGSAEGTLEVRGKQGQGIRVSTTGVMRNGLFVWKGIVIHASTDYVFTDNVVSFERLLVASGATNLVLRGKAQRGFVSVDVKGALDGAHIVHLLQSFHGSRSVKGTVDLDGHVEAREGGFSTTGKVDLTRVAFDIPRVVRKASGVESRAFVAVRRQAGGEVFVDNVDWTMGEMKGTARFDATKGKISNAHLVLDAPRVERLAGLFFFDPVGLKGHLRADLWIKEIFYPVERLPFVTGNVSLTGGVFRLPSMAKALTNVDLSCRLDGARFVLDSSGLQAGKSRLVSAHLIVDGIDAPVFSLVLRMSDFDPLDFVPADGKPFRLPVISNKSLMSRARGTFLLKADRLEVGHMAGKDAEVTGSLAHRTVTVDRGSMKTGAGSVNLRGSARLAEVPRINVTGELKDVAAKEAFSLIGASTDILEGTGSVKGTLELEGRSGPELARSASGAISVLSRNGAVRKWNLVSKLLAFTNVYDLLRGRVDLSRNGLVYRKLSASFEGKEGSFHTDDFLIESPAMVIAGQGDVDVGKKTIDARMVVSPLVEMDRLIDWVPILRSIVKEKRTGLISFMYNVKGPVNDPEIESSYVQSMGRRAFNIIWNAIRLPKSIVDRLPEVVDGFPKGLFEK